MSKAKGNKSDEANDQETLSTQDLFKMLMEMRQQDREENQRREEREARWRAEKTRFLPAGWKTKINVRRVRQSRDRSSTNVNKKNLRYLQSR